MPPPRILCVHGVGDHHTSPAWEDDWRDAIDRSLAPWSPGVASECDFVTYDDIFAKHPLNPLTYGDAFFRLSGSAVEVGAAALADRVSGAVGGLVTGIEGLFRSRGLEDVPAVLRWTAGMVAQWASEDTLRAECRARVTQAMKDFQPDVVVAHSLGTLVCYDTFVRASGRALLKDRRLVTFGSQIATPFVRGAFGGRLVPLPDALHWYQLFNPNDRAFTAPIRLAADNFTRVQTSFQDGFVNHDAVHYLSHPNAVDAVWREVAAPPSRGIAKLASRMAEKTKQLPRQADKARRDARRQDRRALLIGINEYANPAMRLDGCVNDAFLISAALQESGFEPEHIRCVFDDRATAATIRDRLNWLLDDTEAGDERVLFYSGHGAQMPQYGPGAEVDHLQECLVPYDFDWTPQKAITDEFFVNLYSQLPYDATVLAILDCCHAGGLAPAADGAQDTRVGNGKKPSAASRRGGDGMSRGQLAPASGGMAKVRGVAPPDDIRHRALKWSSDLEMWEPRPLPPATPDDSIARGERREAFVGSSGASYRFGRALAVRTLPEKEKNRELKDLGHLGPFVPLVLQACQENELAYEYRHGVTSYGAFTYCLYHILRDARRGGKPMTFQQLAAQTSSRLHDRLGYQQTPCLFGASAVVKRPIPWNVVGVEGSAGAKTG